MEKPLKSHCASLLGGIADCRRLNKYTDVQVESTYGGRTFQCHKLVLAAASPVLDAMLQVQMTEQLSSQIHLPYDEETIDAVLRFIYTGDRIITRENLFPVYQAANYLDIGPLIQYSEDCLKSHLSVENCVGCWKMGMHLNRINVAEMAKSVVLTNFAQLCTEDTVMELGFSDLMMLLKDALLNCVTATKCKALVLWHALHDVEDSKMLSLVKELLSGGVFSRVDLENVVKDDAFFAGISTSNVDKVQRIRELYRDLLSDMSEHSTTSCSSIVPHSVAPGINTADECLLVIGGNPDHDRGEVIMLNVRESKWYRLPPVPGNIGYNYAVCSEGGTLYVSGGNVTPERFLKFHCTMNKWDIVEPLPVGREQHNMCGVDKHVYVLGGTRSRMAKHQDIHVYNVTDRTWIKSGQVACPVTHATTAVVGTCIYIIGGIIEDKGFQPSDMIQCFDTKSRLSWTLRKNLPFKAKRNTVVAASLNDITYIVHKGNIYELQKDSVVRRMCVMDSSSCPVRDFGVAVIGGKVFIFGGEDTSFNVSTRIIQYCQDVNTLVCLPVESPWPLKDFAFTTLQIPVGVQTASAALLDV